MNGIELSQEQLACVESDALALVVVAGAGSGKTEIVARRIERILEMDVAAETKVLAVSYTVKAADELRDRLAARLGDVHRRATTDTIHGFAHSILRQQGSNLGLPPEPEVLHRMEDRVAVLEDWLREAGMPIPDDSEATLRAIDLARARLETAPFLDSWRSALSARSAVDFAAMLDLAIELLTDDWIASLFRRLYVHVIVDEAQNLTPVQYLFLKTLIGEPTTQRVATTFVGDERQSIIGFAGADRLLISKFAHEYHAERIELRVNYRSAKSIIDLGRAVAFGLDLPSDAVPPTEFPANGEVSVAEYESEAREGEAVAEWIHGLLSQGLPEDALAPGESNSVRPEEIAVLARVAAALTQVGRCLQASGLQVATASTEDDWVSSSVAKIVVESIAFRSADHHLTTRKRIELLSGTPENSSWTTLSEILGRSSVKDVPALVDVVEAKDAESLMGQLANLELEDENWASDLLVIQDAWAKFVDSCRHDEWTFGNLRQHILRTQRGDALAPGIRLHTIHKAQGREFRAVAVVACNEGQFPDFRATSSENRLEELRAFYVAVSRPSRVLRLTRPKFRTTKSGSRMQSRSSFLEFVSQSAPPSD